MSATRTIHWITANLADTPYNVVERLPPHELVLQYGNTSVRERWREAHLRNVPNGTYVIVVGRKRYRFAGRIN